VEHLYQPVFIRYADGDGNRLAASQAKDSQGRLLPGVSKIKGRSKTWYGKYRDHNREVKRVPLSPDKSAAKSLLHELVIKAERRRAGRGDPFEEYRNRDLVCPTGNNLGQRYDRQKRKYHDCKTCGPKVSDYAKHVVPHLSAYRRHLQGKNDAQTQVAQTIRRIRAVLEGCKAKRLGDLTGNRVSDCLALLRAKRLSAQTSNY
jgi:hypothetical protein